MMGFYQKIKEDLIQ